MKSTRLFARVLLAIIFIAIFALMGCGIVPLTPLPTRTPTPTQPICPPISIDTPSPLGNQPILIIALVEQQIDSSEWAETLHSFQILKQVVPSIAQPEDRLIMFYQGPRVYDDAFISDESVGSVGFVKPSIPATPTSYPTVTPTSTPATPTPEDRIVQIATERSADATQTQVIATTTQNAFLDQCSKLKWATSYAAVGTEWAVTQESAIQTLTSNIQVSKTPGASGETYQNEVYEGFSHVTRKFTEYSCIKQSNENKDITQINSPYARCILLIFSNMDEWRTVEYIKDKMPVLNSKIDLHGIEVAVVMLNCNDMSENYCLTQEGFWTDQLKDYGAISVDFLSRKDIEYYLTIFLGRR